ncbi:stage II sporulation protein M [Candidatus Woesearchaeota archaeon]|nr:stage II sporulation protein M [Candidatus Woesearchaeota archaeon]
MVLDNLFKPVDAEKQPWQMFFLGILFSTIAMFVSYFIFKTQSSLIMVFLVVLLSFPIVYNTIKFEEQKDELNLSEKTLLVEHSKALFVFMFLFLGIMLSLTLWYVLLPDSYTSFLFKSQIDTISSINGQISGNAFHFDYFTNILLNNLRVLIICVLFSFIYGVGAMFILTWNATVIAAAIGTFIKKQLVNVTGYASSAGVINIVSIGISKYMVHGIFEILSYFIAALAGGLISIAVIRHKVGTKAFKNIVFDVSELLVISIAVLVFAAVIEVYVSYRVF